MTLPPKPRKSARWSSYCLLALAIAAWSVILTELGRLYAPTVFLITAGTGVVGYCLHRFVWKWRGAVAVTVFLLYLAVMTGPSAFYGYTKDLSEFAELCGVVLFAPFGMAVWDLKRGGGGWSRETLFHLFTALSPILAAGHPIRPSLVMAIVTTIGIGIWFSISAAMMAFAA